MKKIFTLFAALVCGFVLNAKTLYLNPGVWDVDGAKFAIYGSAGEWGWLTGFMAQEGTVYKADVPDNTDVVIFVRLNPNGESPAAPDWKDKWNQTGDLSLEDLGDKNQYNITGWNAGDGEWSVYGGGGDNPGGGGDNPGGGETGKKYWYWKGHVDGEDLNNELEGGIFECGLSSIEVKEDAYLIVIYQEQGVAGVQYGAASFVNDQTHATLSTSGYEKLHIPAGSYTLYLYNNGNGTVELAYEAMNGKTLVACTDGDEAIETTTVQEKARKVFVDGQLRIVRGDKMFDATGRQL